MSDPEFIHLRLHSEYSISDGIVRIDDAVQRAEADAMPALALTDLSNLFGMVKFYQDPRVAKASNPSWVAMCGSAMRPIATGPAASCCWRKTATVIGCLSELLTRAYRENMYRGRAELRAAWFGETGTAGPDCVVRRAIE